MSGSGEKFRAQYRVDEATIAKTNEIGRKHGEKLNSKENNSQATKGNNDADCGRGISGDESGRVSAFTNQESGKTNRAAAVKSVTNKSQTANTGSRSAAVNANARSAAVQGAVSGQSAGQGAKGAAASSGGQSSGGQGGQSGGSTGGGQSGGQSGGGQGR